VSDVPTWLKRILEYGESVQAGSPEWRSADRPNVLSVLETAFRDHALDVAGLPVSFNPAAAEWAARCLADACWRLVGDGTSAPVRPREPDSPSAHLSADVTLRFLPTVYRRAKARGTDHPLVKDLDAVFRAWPLSGILADLDGSPTGSVDFFGHAGLQVLYAERLAATGRADWVPADGVGRDRVAYAYVERGRPMPVVVVETDHE
jgi:MoxR-vWA-beta-propeller ternary system domain bpX4